MRFIQIKSRKLKDNVFGFTLKSKDIRADPRHAYLLYSDNTSKDKQDFLILSVKDYLKFFKKNNLKSPFAPTSFRKGNNKLNSLKYDAKKDQWKWGKNNWQAFRNLEGMEKIQDPKIDTNLEEEIQETRILADELQKVFSRGNSYQQETEIKINKELKRKTKALFRQEKHNPVKKKSQKPLKFRV